MPDDHWVKPKPKGRGYVPVSDLNPNSLKVISNKGKKVIGRSRCNVVAVPAKCTILRSLTKFEAVVSRGQFINLRNEYSPVNTFLLPRLFYLRQRDDIQFVMWEATHCFQ